MTWATPFYILLSIVLVLMNGFFVLSEFALVKARATRIEEMARRGSRRAALAREMISKLDAYLSATQLGITVASLGLGWVGEPAFAGLIQTVVDLPERWSPAVSHTISMTVAFALITFLHIWIGELARKSLAIRRAEESVLAVAYPMRWAYYAFYLPMRVLNGASNWLLRRMGLEVEHTELAHSAEELRMLLATVPAGDELSLNRLLVIENLFDLSNQSVGNAMKRWAEVKWIARGAGAEDLRRAFAEHRFSRLPVLDERGLPIGYLLAKDLIVGGGSMADWVRHIRPLRAVRPQDNLEAALRHLQRDGANMAVVMGDDRPVGLITLEDVLEEIIGPIEDEHSRPPRAQLRDALEAGGVLLDVQAQTGEEAIAELTGLIPKGKVPPGVDVAALAIARERQVSTDIGLGVAIPHARCLNLHEPILVFGRSIEGILFSPHAIERVGLMFLLVTPIERPNIQVFLLSQLATIIRSEFVRGRLERADSAQEVMEIIAAAESAMTG